MTKRDYKEEKKKKKKKETLFPKEKRGNGKDKLGQSTK